MLSYQNYADNDSLYNTPPVFAIYMVYKTLHWIKAQGGVKTIAARNREKAQLIYDVIDASRGFYRGHAEKNSRSLMNITFNLPTQELEKDFIAEGKKRGFIGIGRAPPCRRLPRIGLQRRNARSLPRPCGFYERIPGKTRINGGMNDENTCKR